MPEVLPTVSPLITNLKPYNVYKRQKHGVLRNGRVLGTAVTNVSSKNTCPCPPKAEVTGSNPVGCAN